MRRRDFFKTAAGAATFWSFATRAESAIPTMGVLHGVAAAQWADRMVGFHKGLGEAGFVEGRNLAVEYRWAEGQFDRLPAMAADIVNQKVAVILAGASDVAIKAAMAATKTIPIVFTTASDPPGRVRNKSQSSRGKRYRNYFYGRRSSRQAYGAAA
jgi:putative tryptophan/tyrosine transport system substrate-binding protein